MLSFFKSKNTPIERGYPPNAKFETNAMGGKISNIPCADGIRPIDMAHKILSKVLGFETVFTDIDFDPKTKRLSFRAIGFLSRYVGVISTKYYAYLNGDIACVIDLSYRAEVF